MRLVSQLNFLDDLYAPVEVDVWHEFSKLIDKCNSNVRDQGPDGLCSRLCFVPVIRPVASESIRGPLSSLCGLFLRQRCSWLSWPSESAVAVEYLLLNLEWHPQSI